MPTKTLLVIDRHRRTRRELCGLLEARYRVVTAHSVFSAFRILRRQKLDLVVVKSAARDAYAIAVLKWLQLHQVQIPVVMLLGSASSRDARVARQLGVNSILHWPVPRADLLTAVASAEVTADPGAGLSPEHAGQACHPQLEQGDHDTAEVSPGNGRARARPARYRDRHRAAWYVHGRGRWRLC